MSLREIMASAPVRYNPRSGNRARCVGVKPDGTPAYDTILSADHGDIVPHATKIAARLPKALDELERVAEWIGESALGDAEAVRALVERLRDVTGVTVSRAKQVKALVPYRYEKKGG